MVLRAVCGNRRIIATYRIVVPLWPGIPAFVTIPAAQKPGVYDANSVCSYDQSTFRNIYDDKKVGNTYRTEGEADAACPRRWRAGPCARSDTRRRTAGLVTARRLGAELARDVPQGCALL